MGTYIKAYAEQRHGGQWVAASIDRVLIKGDDSHAAHVWDTQNYTMFGWLADVRNYAMIPPLSQPRGLPPDVSDEIAALYHRTGDNHSCSWVLLEELSKFDYDATFEDRRTGDGGHQYGDTYPSSMGRIVTYRSIFADTFWEDIEAMKKLARPEYVRVVFWFD
jgi:hypothetical protein